MQTRFGEATVERGDYLEELTPNATPSSDEAQLRQTLHDEGFLFIRGLIPREAVMQARRVILEHVAEQGALVPDTPPLLGVMPQGNERKGKTLGFMGHHPITKRDEVKRVLEAPELFALFDRIFGEPSMTFTFKWLRAVGNEQFTGAHYDHVYMGRGSGRLHTTWLPLGDVPVEQGSLAICKGSHSAEGFRPIRETYGKMDIDRDRVVGWFTHDPTEITDKFGGRWATTDYHAGDVVIFGMHLMHASTTNTTDRYRLSCDVRFQPQADPKDDRWVGANPPGHYTAADAAEVETPMAEARKQWGIA
jgi:hypothetical protein